MDEVVENKMILNAYRGVLRSIKSRRSKEETKIIRKAFNLAVNAHRNDRRKSGEPYIFHPLANFLSKNMKLTFSKSDI